MSQMKAQREIEFENYTAQGNCKPFERPIEIPIVSLTDEVTVTKGRVKQQENLFASIRSWT